MITAEWGTRRRGRDVTQGSCTIQMLSSGSGVRKTLGPRRRQRRPQAADVAPDATRPLRSLRSSRLLPRLGFRRARALAPPGPHPTPPRAHRSLGARSPPSSHPCPPARASWGGGGGRVSPPPPPRRPIRAGEGRNPGTRGPGGLRPSGQPRCVLGRSNGLGTLELLP